MGLRRTDSPVHRTYVLSGEAESMLSRLADHFASRERRVISKSEVVERAVRALAKRINGAKS